MITRTKFLALTLVTALVGSTAVGCVDDRRRNERWATTENTNVKIDWDKVNEAYQQADGPADLERRINEFYEGDEVISIAVHDREDRSQVVTGFFDKDRDGQVADAEKIFTITRDVTGDGQAQYQTSGYGPYVGYHSPMMSIVTGMMLGSMMSSVFAPRYVPMYTQPYTTSPTRHAEISHQRSGYRAANPSRFTKPSRTGRHYGGGPSRSSPGRSRGGGSFGLQRAGRTTRPRRLEA